MAGEVKNGHIVFIAAQRLKQLCCIHTFFTGYMDLVLRFQRVKYIEQGAALHFERFEECALCIRKTQKNEWYWFHTSKS